MSGDLIPHAESVRVHAAQLRAAERRERERSWLRPLGLALIAIVIVSTAEGHPAPGVSGRSAGVTAALAVWVLVLGRMLRSRGPHASVSVDAVTVAALGAAGIALAALQYRGATEVAGSVGVWVAVTRLPTRLGLVTGVAITIGLDVASALAGSDSASVLASTLLCALLGVMAHFMKLARESEDRTEVLLAELEDAREDQTRAAAVAERGRIAGELHDVLAHSLSGAAIQLQGARMLAEREESGEALRAAIERSSRLVREGLAEARQAVGALRGERLPAVDDLPALVESFRTDMNVDARLSVEGTARPLPAEAGLALYRGAQEALTNAARYAPGHRVQLDLRYDAALTRLTVADHPPDAGPASSAGSALTGVGGGRGLSGMRERIERVGGRMSAGTTNDGWAVELEVPA